MLKILQARIQQYMNWEFPHVQTGFRKGRRNRDQIANIHCIIEKAREFQKNIYFLGIEYTEDFVWITTVQSSSVSPLCPTLWDPMDCSTPGFHVHHQLLELAQTHVRWGSDAIQPSSSSVVPFSYYLQSFPASESFPMSPFFTQDGQRIGVSASTSVFPMKIQDWFPLGLTGLVFLQSKWLSRVFFNTRVQKHQFFAAQHSLWSNSQSHTWLLEKP